jgi:type I restriction enzyme S subunit
MSQDQDLKQLISGDFKVERKKLEEISNIKTGDKNAQDKEEEGSYPFFVRSAKIERINSFSHDGEAILVPGEGGVGNIFHYINGKFDVHQRVYKISDFADSVSGKYIYHYMRQNFGAHATKKSVKATVESLRLPMFKSFLIPLPPLKIQKQIADILDKFTELEAELDAELEARIKQYEWYRENYFSNLQERDGVNLTRLDEIALITRGKGIKKDQVQKSGVPCIRYGEIYTQYKNSAEKLVSHVTPSLAKECVSINADDVVMAITGEDRAEIGKSIVYNGESSAVVGGDTVVIQSKEHSGKYINHFFNSLGGRRQLSRISNGMTVLHLSTAKLKRIKIPLPPIREQKEIAEKLDHFDALVNDMKSGIPAEIAARRKQYEYYRKKLLSFSEN